MSGIYQKQVNSGSVVAPSAGRTLISVNETGELFTKDSSGNVTIYSSGSGSPFPFTGSADISGTLNVDFTDTLSYITEEDYEMPFGKAYIDPLGWQDLTFVNDFMGSAIVEDNYSIFNFVEDGITQIGSLGISFPSQVSGQLLTVNSGSLSGSSLTNVLTYSDSTAIGGGEQFLDQKICVWVDPVSSDISWFLFQSSFDENLASSVWSKRNNAGEQVEMKLDDSQEGFKISNDLSDNTASVLRIEDNNGDAKLEIFNDSIFLGTLATSSAGLSSGSLYTQTSAQLGGSGATKVLCIV